MKANVDLQIDELVLAGLPSAQRDQIAAAVEAELARLLGEADLPTSLQMGTALSEVRVDGLRVDAGSKPDDVGAKIAGAIYSNLAGERGSS